MSTPAEKVAATIVSDDSGQQGTVELTFSQRINEALNVADKDSNGNIILPDDMPEDLKFAALTEKRRRDTQSALAKTTSAYASSQAENEELTKLLQDGSSLILTADQATELDALKFSDPEAWRERLNELEQTTSAEMAGKLSTISDKAKLAGIIGERKVLFEAFMNDNPELVINNEVLKNDIPPRITRALEAGEISYVQFLGKIKEYVESGSVVESQDPEITPNLSDVGGSDIPGDVALIKDTETKYEDVIF